MIHTKTDITRDGDEELSSQIQNDEYLYELYNKCVRRQNWNHLKLMLDEQFIYTDEQLQYLQDEWELDTEVNED